MAKRCRRRDGLPCGLEHGEFGDPVPINSSTFVSQIVDIKHFLRIKIWDCHLLLLAFKNKVNRRKKRREDSYVPAVANVSPILRCAWIQANAWSNFGRWVPIASLSLDFLARCFLATFFVPIDGLTSRWFSKSRLASLHWCVGWPFLSMSPMMLIYCVSQISTVGCRWIKENSE